MSRYHLQIFFGDNWIKQIIEADYIEYEEGLIEFYLDGDDEDVLVAVSPIEKTFIYKIERKNE